MRPIDPLALSNLSLPAKWLGVFMAAHENRNGEVKTTVAELRAWTGLSKAALRDAIDDLVNSRFLTEVQSFKPGPNSSAKFALTWEDTPRRSATPPEIRHDVAQLVSGDAETAVPDTPRINTPEIPSPLNNPSSNPPVLSSLVSLSFSNRIREQEVTDKDEVVSHARTQSVMLAEFIEPEWIEILTELASIKVAPGITGVSAHDQPLVNWAKEKGYAISDAIETATYLKSVWPMKGRKSLRATFQNLLHRQRERRLEREANGPHNGRYPRRGLGPAVIPDDPSYYDPGSKLSAFRPR